MLWTSRSLLTLCRFNPKGISTAKRQRCLNVQQKVLAPLHHMPMLLTPKFGKVRSLTCGSNSVRNPYGGRKVSSDEFGRRVRGRQFASARNCCADFAGLRGDVARMEGTNGWISDRI
jgi:hypothetical protein